MIKDFLQRWQTPLVAGAAACVVAGLGGAVTEIGPWYQSLQKPSWQPPDWLFGPVWTVIYGLCAWSAVIAWNRTRETSARILVLGLFALTGFLNVFWSWCFFAARRPDWALVEVFLLWLSIVMLIWCLRVISTKSSWLLVPYLIWVSFAGFLNWTVVQLNYPF